jgi:hypothetical protein
MEIIIIVYILFCLLIAELIGRRKHIGFWWSFILLVAGLINGIIAIIFSPSVKKEPTIGANYHFVIGIIFFIFMGLTPLLMTLSEISEIIYWQSKSLIYPYYTVRIGISFSFIITGIYLIQLSRNKINNQNPKLYTLDLKYNSNIFYNNSKLENLMYYLIENGKQSEAYTYSELITQKIKEDTLVWRKGLKDWTQAKYLSELKNIIEFAPPPLPFSNDEPKHEIIYEIEKEPNKNEILSKKIEKYSFIAIVVFIIILVLATFLK